MNDRTNDINDVLRKSYCYPHVRSAYSEDGMVCCLKGELAPRNYFM